MSVVGSFLAAGEVVQVQAKVIAPDTRAGFVAGLRSAGLIFAGISLATAGVGGVVMWRWLPAARPGRQR